MYLGRIFFYFWEKCLHVYAVYVLYFTFAREKRRTPASTGIIIWRRSVVVSNAVLFVEIISSSLSLFLLQWTTEIVGCFYFFCSPYYYYYYIARTPSSSVRRMYPRLVSQRRERRRFSHFATGGPSPRARSGIVLLRYYRNSCECAGRNRLCPLWRWLWWRRCWWWLL